MSGAIPSRGLLAAASAAALAGVALACFAAAVTPGRLRAMQRRANDLGAVEALRAEAHRMDPWFAKLEATPPAAPGALRALAAAAAPHAAAPEIADETLGAVSAGWVCRRHTVTFGSVAPLELGRFVVACETSRPPWRLLQARLAARGGPDAASATLVFEGLERGVPAAAEGRAP